MTTAATKLMTAEEFYDFCNLPENRDRHFELDQGKVIEMSRPGERHGFTCHNVNRILGNYCFQRGQGYVCSNDTGVIWERDPDTVRGPDILYRAQDRDFEELHPKYSEDPPELAIEVLSPTDRPSRVIARAYHFLHRGARQVWVLDPEDRTLTVYLPNTEPKILQVDDEITAPDLLPEFRCRVGDFFLTPREAKRTPPPPAS
jgi:Uma2 family endonuclease